MKESYLPKWHRELAIFRRVKPVLILEGNILDVYRRPDTGEACGLGEYLQVFLRACGYRNIAFYNSRRGFTNAYNPGCLRDYAAVLGLSDHQLSERAAFRGKNGELREETTWHNVTAWAGRNIMDFRNIRKGTFVSLVGRLRNTRFTGNDGNERSIVEVVAGRLEPYTPAAG